MIDFPMLTIEEAEPGTEDRPLIGEALRLLATWLGRLERMPSKSERKAA